MAGPALQEPEIFTVASHGWSACTRMRLQGLQLTVTNEVGPRIIECSLDGGPNLFKEFPDQLGKTQGEEYLLFGGHRLWHAPEAFPRSYARDFGAVEVELVPGGARFNQMEEHETRVRKSIEVSFAGPRQLRLKHRIVNGNPWPIELAPWAMTLLAGGTRVIVPQEPWRPHPQHLDPARTLTLWGYTRMDDPRVSWGRHFIRLREDSNVPDKFKVGIANHQGWIASHAHGWMTTRTYTHQPDAVYPDCGSSCELFTMPGFVEVETLGPLELLAPGEDVEHEEVWQFWQLEEWPEDESELAEVIAPFLAQLQYPGVR